MMNVERDAVGGTGSARRRRERRLRSMLRHERMAVAMAVAESLHHSAQRPEKARAREVEEQDQHEALRRQKAPPPGKPPGVLKDPEPQGRDGQHSGIGHEVVQALGVPVLQMVEQPVDASALAFIKEEEAEAKDLEVECMELGPCRLPQVLGFARADEGRSAKASAPPEKVAG